MCVATKSSKRDLAPGTSDGGVRAGSFCRHCTAAMYCLRSALDRRPLLHIVSITRPLFHAVSSSSLPFFPNRDVISRAGPTVAPARRRPAVVQGCQSLVDRMLSQSLELLHSVRGRRRLGHGGSELQRPTRGARRRQQQQQPVRTHLSFVPALVGKLKIGREAC